ncbi:hypothetical protein Q7378_10185 [Glaesserella parasuis]|uniref:hypothetical protein n=1 Tax=Glaesserella parasuis TaxID=738 RepID=UPI0013214D2D|nr:hypothetical protein [Glaesserella parasuis]MDO9925049.1 hypothetical protein [Glaesserella parasuis]MDO9940212.1 hypothetical protein [Glaesserella parasuis]MDO9942289.1 hypothetical protein [Glaesserella parasuis]MDP0012452.1 hypothetical protein [Glaesserella parasuis]MDP0054815.1 hypothetical protein [Glaesserella parasuis]
MNKIFRVIWSKVGVIAIASSSEAEGSTAILGSEASATGAQAVAIGNFASATGSQSVTIGANTKAEGYGSISIGGDDLNTTRYQTEVQNHSRQQLRKVKPLLLLGVVLWLRAKDLLF